MTMVFYVCNLSAFLCYVITVFSMCVPIKELRIFLLNLGIFL